MLHPPSSSSSLALSLYLAIFVFGFLWLNCSGGEAKVDLFKTCPSPGGTVHSINISSCTDNDTVCPLKHNTNVTLDLEFTTKKMAKKVTISIYGIIRGVPLPFPVYPSNACNAAHNLTCPLKPGQLNYFRLNLPVSPLYPLLPVKVNVNLLDGSRTKIACINFDAQIIK